MKQEKKFKAPTRLETLMQDVPKLIKNGELKDLPILIGGFVFLHVKIIYMMHVKD